MNTINIIRAWKDEEYRLSLSDAERAMLPPHPAGWIELTDAEMGTIVGGFLRAPQGSRPSHRHSRTVQICCCADTIDNCSSVSYTPSRLFLRCKTTLTVNEQGRVRPAISFRPSFP